MNNTSQIISKYLQSEINRGSFPGAQYAIGADQLIIAEDALGLAVIEPERVPTTLDTIYDLASLTKPLVTAPLVVKFCERGLLSLTAPVAHYLTEFECAGMREITLLELLTHTSGLPNWRPLYLEAETREDVPDTIARVLLEQGIHGSPDVAYSDLNYILLGFVLERVSGMKIDRLAEREIFKPLGLKRTAFNPSRDWLKEIAATEQGQDFECANAAAIVRSSIDWPHNRRISSSNLSRLSHRWREGIIHGEVHDGNANFMGGVAGHAGLFSSAREAFRIANQCLVGSELLKPESLHLFRNNLTPGRSTSRSIAWILADTPDCSAGSALPGTAFGHNGFTGSSIWVDPDQRRVFVLLTNRVHPRVEPIDMREIRRRFNTLAVETMNNDA